MRLIPVLHLHDEVLARVGGAVDVIYEAPVVGRKRKLLLVAEPEVADVSLTLKEGVEKINQDVLVDFLTEYPLEADIREGVKVS